MYYVCINSQYLCMNVFIPWYCGITADDTVGAECTVSEKVGLGLLTFITQRAHNVLHPILKVCFQWQHSTSELKQFGLLVDGSTSTWSEVVLIHFLCQVSFYQSKLGWTRVTRPQQ